MTSKKTLLSRFLIAILLLGLAACSLRQETDYDLHSKALPGAIIGGTAGLAIGAAAFSHGGVPLAILGGVAAGSLLGYLNDAEFAVVYRLQQEGVQVLEVGDYLILVLESDQFYDVHSPCLKAEPDWILRDVARLLKDIEKSQVLIAAYTDNVGSPRFNRELSQQQAERMKSFLWAHGIDFRRLHAIGFGEDYPIANNRTVIGNAMNRRIEIRLSKSPDLVI